MAKRGNNEGSIRQRPNGLWEARLTLPGGQRRSFYGDTRDDVRCKLNQAMHDRDKGMPIVAERQTLGKYLVLQSQLRGRMGGTC
jgi:hypothetical protein